MTRTDDIPAAWDERTVLTTMLDYARDTVRAKCEGVSEEDARRAILPGSPLMTISGLVNHLRWVEKDWIEVKLLGRPDTAEWTDEDPDWEMRVAVEYPLERLLAEYEEQAAGYRELVAGMDLDTRSVKTLRDGTAVTLRWILHHLVEETARHNGHLDIIREILDGSTGT